MFVSLSFLLPPVQTEARGQEQAQVKKECVTPSMVQLGFQMRRLWLEHVVWTRNYIVSAVAGSEDQKQVLTRLLKNQQDLGDAVKPFYGEKAGNKLAALLREHILIAGKIVDAAKQGKTSEVEALNKVWYRNADEIALFLSKANPHWSQKDLTKLLYKHLQLVTEAARTRIGKDWEGDIRAFDEGQAHILMLADALSEGIFKQFPDRFR